MPTDPRPAVAKRISGHQGVTVGESVAAIAEHFGPLTGDQREEIAAVMVCREEWALRREREENAATEIQAASDMATLKFEVDHLRPLLSAAVADRDRYRAALEQVAERPTDFTLDAEANMCAVREYARVSLLAPAAPGGTSGRRTMMATVKCNHPAVTAALWPSGQRLVLCERHYQWATKVAGAMGFPLTADELRDGEVACTQNVQPEEAFALAGGEPKAATKGDGR